MINNLSLLNLSDKEQIIYQALLQMGLNTPSYLSKTTGINRSTIYLYLQQLKQKGLVIESLTKNKTYFEPTDKKVVKQLIRSKINSLKQLQGDLSRISSNSQSHKDPSFTNYQGVNGALEIAADIAKSAEDLYILGSLAGLQQFIGTPGFDKIYTIPRRKQMTMAYEITDHCPSTLEVFFEQSESFIKIRFVPQGLGTNGMFLVYGHKLVVAQYKPSLSAVVINNPSLVAFFKLSFNCLWKELEGKNIPQQRQQQGQ